MRAQLLLLLVGTMKGCGVVAITLAFAVSSLAGDSGKSNCHTEAFGVAIKTVDKICDNLSVSEVKRLFRDELCDADATKSKRSGDHEMRRLVQLKSIITDVLMLPLGPI